MLNPIIFFMVNHRCPIERNAKSFPVVFLLSKQTRPDVDVLIKTKTLRGFCISFNGKKGN